MAVLQKYPNRLSVPCAVSAGKALHMILVSSLNQYATLGHKVSLLMARMLLWATLSHQYMHGQAKLKACHTSKCCMRYSCMQAGHACIKSVCTGRMEFSPFCLHCGTGTEHDIYKRTAAACHNHFCLSSRTDQSRCKGIHPFGTLQQVFVRHIPGRPCQRKGRASSPS